MYYVTQSSNWKFEFTGPNQILEFILPVYIYVKTNKANAKRGISPHLKIWPGDLDLWAMTLKITIFREDPSVQYQNHISWRKVQMVNFYVWMCITAH
jgi:hypothetical protein